MKAWKFGVANNTNSHSKYHDIRIHGSLLFVGSNIFFRHQIWQCGGQMFDAPCSRIGHIYRKFAPFPNNAKGDFVGRVRTLEFVLNGWETN